jgi:hypothetical protein
LGHWPVLSFLSMTETQQATKPRKGRSPNYPGIDLGQAVVRAATLWDHDQHHPIPAELIFKHWDYAPKSGPGSVTYAALKRFGLLEETGDGRAKLTDLAQRILLAERTGEPNYKLRQKAALQPTVHTDLWKEYGSNLPSDEHLKYNLVRDKNFTQGGAGEFIKQWKRTMDYARLSGAVGTVAGSGGDAEKPEDQIMTPPTIEQERPAEVLEAPPEDRQEARSTRTIQVTYSPTEWALLQGQFPMSENDWDAMIDVLNAMKRGLVTPSD